MWSASLGMYVPPPPPPPPPHKGAAFIFPLNTVARTFLCPANGRIKRTRYCILSPYYYRSIPEFTGKTSLNRKWGTFQGENEVLKTSVIFPHPMYFSGLKKRSFLISILFSRLVGSHCPSAQKRRSGDTRSRYPVPPWGRGELTDRHLSLQGM